MTTRFQLSLSFVLVIYTLLDRSETDSVFFRRGMYMNYWNS